MDLTDFKAIVAAVEASAEAHECRPPTNEAALAGLRERLGDRLPADLAALYSTWHGAWFANGDLTLYQIEGCYPKDDEDQLTVEHATAFLREAQWPLPEELLVIGDDGSEDLYGLWLPAMTEQASPVVVVGAVFEPGCMAVAGTSLFPFLRAQLAQSLLLGGGPEEALDALGVPADLRDPEADEDALHLELLAWADPTHPEPGSDPYEALHDAAQINRLLGGD